MKTPKINKSFQRVIALVLVVAATFIINSCSQPLEQVHLSGPTMGTGYNVKYLVNDDTPDQKTLQAEIDKRLELVNDQMSTYRKDSELSRFNQSKAGQAFEVSEDTATVVREAMRLNKVTEGALDVTVGPLVNLWGFGPEARPDQVPSKALLEERFKITGIQHLKEDGNSLTKDIDDLYVDLSTIAKGWGVDVIADYLDSIGVHNYMVEVGGEIRLKGINADEVPWRIAIEKPVTDERAIQDVIEPGDMAIATSGDYRNYFEEDGVRYSHIINPKTGYPINNKVVSVTVLDKSCMTADGLATGLMVLGEEEGIRIANEHGIAAMMIVKTKDGFKEYQSEAFKPFAKQR